MPYIEESLKKFNLMAPEIIFTVDSEWTAARADILEKKYDVDFSALIIFIATDDISPDRIPEYLKREFGINDGQAQEITKDLREQIVNPLLERINFVDPDQDIDNMPPEREKAHVIELFEKNLTAELNGNPYVVNAINRRIFHILSKEADFKNEIEHVLYKNSEKITYKTFEFDGKPRTPSIRNWLSDFIKQEGTGMFDNVVMTKFASYSPNAKILDREEKESIQKLLRLYRNIKFFPQSMPSDDGTDWEIIPVMHTEEYLEKARAVSGPPQTEEEKKIEELEEAKRRLEEGESFEKKLIEEEGIKTQRRIEDLKILLRQYKEGTLECKAIREELKKLEGRSKE